MAVSSSSAARSLHFSEVVGGRLRPAVSVKPSYLKFRSPAVAASGYTYSERRRNCASPVLVPAVPAPSLYDVLGIPVGASGEEIKTAYRRLARSCHPDVTKEGASAEEFLRVHAAYATLSDPTKRADYDRKRPVRTSAAVSPYSGFSRRTWETDQCW